MARDLPRSLMNSGTAGERRLGRALARGRVRLSPEAAEAYRWANQIIKDFSAAGSPVTGDAVHTNVPGGPDETPKQNSRTKTRYTGPYDV